LRDGRYPPSESAKKKIVENTEKLSAALSNSIPSPGTSYRGMVLSSEGAQSFIKNKVLTDKGFTSSSKSEIVAKGFSGNRHTGVPILIKIKGKTGVFLEENTRKYGWKDRVTKYADEKEVLFNKGTKFKVTKVKEKKFRKNVGGASGAIWIVKNGYEMSVEEV
jgi:hypothetical protein